VLISQRDNLSLCWGLRRPRDRFTSISVGVGFG